MSGQSHANGSGPGRRKVRKGTHSCWECRRRKIRCQYTHDNDTICIACRARGSACRSQEFADEAVAVAPERKVTLRLDRLESMMERLMQHILMRRSGESVRGGSSSAAASQRSYVRPSSPAFSSGDADRDGDGDGDGDESLPAVSDMLTDLPTVAARACPTMLKKHGYAHMDVFDTSAADDTPVAALLGIQQSLAHADLDVMARGPPAYHVVSLFHSQHDRDAGRGETPESLAEVPPAGSHPTLVARRLLQLTLCMQQAAPQLQLAGLPDGLRLIDVVGRIADMVAHTVAASDELIGNVEGLQCLVLLGQQQSNCGHLRQAWLSYRRALGLAQLMGLDRGNTRALRSCDPHEDPSRRPSPAALWYRIIACERYLSLMLGLRAGTPDGVFDLPTDTPVERLAKAHTLLTGRLIERNQHHQGSSPPYAVTQAIDADLQAAATCDLDPAWWDVPAYDPVSASPACIFGQTTRSILQVNHYCILIMLHLPFMLRGSDSAAAAAAATAKTSTVAGQPTTATSAPTLPFTTSASAPTTAMLTYSRDTCMRASRALLRRFTSFRQLVSSANSCRHVDYSSLIAAMTLIIGYLGPRPSTSLPAAVQAAFDDQLLQDRAMVEQVRLLMLHFGNTNKDRLSLESAATIQKLLPLLDLVFSTPEAAAATKLPSTAPFHHQQQQQQQQHTTNSIGTSPCPSLSPNSHFAAAITYAPAPASVAAPSMSPVRLNVPYLGTVNIHPNIAAPAGVQTAAIPPHLYQNQNQHQHQHQHQHPASALSSSTSSPSPFGLLSPQPAVLSWHGGDLSMAETGPLDVPDLSTMLVDFDTMTDGNGAAFDGFGASAAFPDMTGASDDWAMQGVDTTYWSLLNGGGGAFGWGA
ncbi:c6 zinc finger domain containing protein [Grosmannia clavigera kw1407]|uniref:C6 zinc finger domain containing protein n=1 Tax=Grosmannia clavigera (strain kw1407 / UAMH 11150) TaxID=655863 RepID=F0XHR8_GROCL|nr:c6 zinc finger domain containing protein [Grosmannia clavigera kw1407]EFX02866.1 c6 zinc finger domain containing protein [Grosmannia clavigera kw1407]